VAKLAVSFEFCRKNRPMGLRNQHWSRFWRLPFPVTLLLMRGGNATIFALRFPGRVPSGWLSESKGWSFF
jgi:hypothetical protein